ncbi:MAG TPA: glycosyltransferase family 4 protein [Chitinophagaceae bacterium]|nr:glycosyltransferase family 4 protein [Chitinophagaceae bacterium]
MKVVFLDTTLDSSLLGGAHTWLYNILRGLKQKGVEVHLVTKGRPGSKTSAKIENSGAIIHNNIWPASMLVEDAAPLLAGWLNKLKPDVFIVSVSPDIGWVVLPYLDPAIATLAIGHNDQDTFYLPAKHYAAFLTKAIGVSDEICRKYTSRSDIPEERVTWIPYGVENDPHEPVRLAISDTKPLTLVYAGRLEDQQKRASDLVPIIEGIKKENIPFHFKIIGDGELYSKIEKQLSGEINAGNVEMPGWIKNGELLNHMRNAGIFILTSAYEGFCISLVEAMANGCCPVVTIIESGNQQLVNPGENGYLVPVGDIQGFIEKIKMLYSDPAMLFRCRQHAWITGKQYNIESMISRYMQCFDEAIISAQKEPRKQDPEFELMESCKSKYPTWLRKIKAKLIQK